MPDMISSEPFEHAALSKEEQRPSSPRNLRVEIGCPSHLSGDLPEGHQHGDDTKFRRICLTATSAWVMSVQIWEHLLTDGREVTSDGAQEEVR